PKQYRAHDVLGLIMKHQGHPDEAVKHFTEALRLEPGDAVAKENLRQVQAGRARKGNRDDLS
ncbi:MAG: tetratricopeptide repeat protein, partial [Gammaproteobacteria bacterium]